MPYYNFKGKREASTIHSEMFKSVVEDFLVTKGYVKQADSSIEGCLTDMVFKNRQLDGDIETHVEVKWAIFNLNDEKTRKEFTEYLLLYFRTPIKSRFKFFIFARDIPNEIYHRDIFERYKENAIERLYDKIKNELSGEDLSFFLSLSIDEFKQFICSVHLIKTDIESLKMKIFEITKEYPLNEDIFLRYSTIHEIESIDKKPDLLYSNLVEINGFKHVWAANSKIKDHKRIKKEITHSPPFYLHEGQLISLYPFEDYNPLKDIIEKDTVKKVSVDMWSKDHDKRRILISLLNKTIVKLCQLRGLYKAEDSYTFYFPNLERKESASFTWMLLEKHLNASKRNKNRQCTRKIYQRYFKNTEYSFYFHIGVEIKAYFLDGKFYFILLPKKVFTEDGVKTVPKDIAKKIEERFRNPRYSYNRNLLLEQLFWAFVLFLDPRIKQTRIKYDSERSKEIQFHTIKILKLLKIGYFITFEIDKRPTISDENVEEDTSILDRQFEQIEGGI